MKISMSQLKKIISEAVNDDLKDNEFDALKVFKELEKMFKIRKGEMLDWWFEYIQRIHRFVNKDTKDKWTYGFKKFKENCEEYILDFENGDEEMFEDYFAKFPKRSKFVLHRPKRMR